MIPHSTQACARLRGESIWAFKVPQVRFLAVVCLLGTAELIAETKGQTISPRHEIPAEDSMRAKNWLPAVFAVLATTTTCYLITANSQEATTSDAAPQDKPKNNKTLIHTRGDYLWLLEYQDKTNLGTEFQTMLRILAGSKVPTAKDAQEVASNYKGTVLGGLSAEEGIDVVGLLRIGIDVPDFANRGDLIWDVRIWRGPEVTQEMWISSTTGAVRCIFPPTSKETPD